MNYEDTGLPQRAINALIKAGWITPGEITYDDLPQIKKLKGIGPTTLKQLEGMILGTVGGHEQPGVGSGLGEGTGGTDLRGGDERMEYGPAPGRAEAVSQPSLTPEQVHVGRYSWCESLAANLLPVLVEKYSASEAAEQAWRIATDMLTVGSRMATEYDFINCQKSAANPGELSVQNMEREKAEEAELIAQGFEKTEDGKWVLRPVDKTYEEVQHEWRGEVDRMQQAGMVYNSASGQWVPRPPEQGAQVRGDLPSHANDTVDDEAGYDDGEDRDLSTLAMSAKGVSTPPTGREW